MNKFFETIIYNDIIQFLLYPLRKSTITEISKRYAIKCHKSTNHKYGKHPYKYHLKMSVDFGMKYLYLIDNTFKDIVISALWCHDTIEDTRQTFNNVRVATNTSIAELVYAVTNEKGKNRKERANKKYYEGIKNTKYATFIKLCDRLANIKHSKDTNSKMIEAYRKENDYFTLMLYDEKYKDMFDEIELLLK